MEWKGGISVEKNLKKKQWKDPAGDILKELQEARKLSSQDVMEPGTVTVDCGNYLTIICC